MLSTPLLAQNGKIDLSVGYFSIKAKSSGEEASISNPSAFRVGYQKELLPSLEFAVGYTILLADFAGSDLGYGLDLGAIYFPLTGSSDEVFKSDAIEVRRYEHLRPYLGLGFYQRQFQSVKNSYAGLGATLGVERYYDKKMNFKAEARYVGLSGSNESTATEMNLLFGVVFKI